MDFDTLFTVSLVGVCLIFMIGLLVVNVISMIDNYWHG
jgi:hypothetical protein